MSSSTPSPSGWSAPRSACRERNSPSTRSGFGPCWKNAGNLALPYGTFVELRLYRNNDNVSVRIYQNILGVSGSTWAWDCTDTFTHGVPTTYMVYATLNSVPECSIDNNTARLTVNEALLHAGK